MDRQAGPEQLRRLLDAVLVVGSELDLQSVLQTIVTAAADLVDARFAALGVLDESQERLADFVTVGVDDDRRQAIGRLPEGHGLLGLLIVRPEPLRLDDLTQHPERFGFPPGHPTMTTFLGVPIIIHGTVFGNLYLCDKTNGEPFTDVDEELVVDLAAAAAIAIQNARLHHVAAQVATISDRERIARELHDVVIQCLFAIGLALQAAVQRSTDDDLSDRLRTVVDDLDATVRAIRSAVFDLQPSPTSTS